MSQQDVEMDQVRNAKEKHTRFQVNKVKSQSQDHDSVISVPDDGGSEDDDNERTLLNSDTDTKYNKSFR